MNVSAEPSYLGGASTYEGGQAGENGWRRAREKTMRYIGLCFLLCIGQFAPERESTAATPPHLLRTEITQAEGEREREKGEGRGRRWRWGWRGGRRDRKNGGRGGACF